MSRAEEIAERLYPEVISGNGWNEWDENEKYRKGCILGYEQAAKDLALTWEDIKAIEALLDEVYSEIWGKNLGVGLNEDTDVYPEVLRRFKELKTEQR